MRLPQSYKKLFAQLALLLSVSLFTLIVSAAAPTSGRDLKAHKKFMSEWPEYEDKALVLSQSPHADRDYLFVLRDNPLPNAFVAGYDVVYVERGLLAILNSEAELAGVLAHEIGHNVGRHSKNRIARHRRNVFLSTVASILVGNSAVGNALMTQATVNSYKYTREAELEADAFGSKYLYGANYEPSQLVNSLACRRGCRWRIATRRSFYWSRKISSGNRRNGLWAELH